MDPDGSGSREMERNTVEKAETIGEDVQLNNGDEPVFPGSNSDIEDIKNYRRELGFYSRDVMQALVECELEGEELWIEALRSWSNVSIENMSSQSLIKLRKILINGKIVVPMGAYISRTEAIIQCLRSRTCPHASTYSIGRTNVDTTGNMAQNLRNQSPTEIADKNVRRTYGIPATREDNDWCNENKKESEKINHEPNNELKAHISLEQRNMDHRDKTEFINNRTRNKTPGANIQSVGKEYSNRKRFKGEWDDDIIAALDMYDTLCDMHGLHGSGKMKGIPVMLDGAAMDYFNAHVKPYSNTYEECCQKLRSWYTSDEQRNRLLQEWHNVKLSTYMSIYPDQSQISVFRKISAKLSAIQRQLHPNYHNDMFLRDQLIRCADNEQLQRAFKERVPTDSQEANQRIAALLSSEPKSASIFNPHTEEYTDENNYHSERRYGGRATRKFKNRKSSRNNKIDWRKIRGCLVCGENHMARDEHGRREINDAIQRHKQKGNVYLSIEDVTQVYDDTISDSCSSETETENDNGEYEETIMNYGLSEINSQITNKLADCSFIHGFLKDRERDMANMTKALSRPEDFVEKFNGVMCDTGANRSSIMSLKQYKSYCLEHLKPAAFETPKIDTTKKKSISGFGGSRRTIGQALVRIPISGLDIIADVTFNIVDYDCPSVLCLRDMKSLGFEISIQTSSLQMGKKMHKLHLENDLLWLKWDSTDQILYTESELRKLHRSFGHPSAKLLSSLLRRARPEAPNVLNELEKIVKECMICAKHSSKPRRFKLTVGTEDYKFNHIVAVDVMHIGNLKVIHCVDEATHFQSAMILKNMKSDTVWRAIRKCWSLVYLGPPDHIRVDQGSNLISEEFKASTESEGITLLEAPIESPQTMTHVERYHAPLRSAFLKIKACIKGLGNDEILSMALKAVNDTVGPEGLCPTLLVFGAIPKPARKSATPTQLERCKALDMAIKEVQKVHAKRRVSFGLKYKGPKGSEQNALDELFPGAHVLVYRPGKAMWEGPFTFIDKIGETVCVQLPHGRRIFRSTAVKPAPPGTYRDEIVQTIMDSVFLNDENYHEFKHSREKELNGLQKGKVFQVVKRSEVEKGTRIYKTMFVDDVRRTPEGQLYLKSRLVARNYRDSAAGCLPTNSPTVSRWAQKLAIALAAMCPERLSYTRDISQAYIQSEAKLDRKVYLEPPKEMNLGEDYLLLALKPLYGIPESGLYWFETYQNHHVERLQMTASTADPCFLFQDPYDNTQEEQKTIPNIAILQVDDSFGFGDQKFLDCEDKQAKRFITKPRIILKPDEPVRFNGVSITKMKNGGYKITQEEKMDLATPTSKESLISLRAKLQYIAGNSRPDIAGVVQLLASEAKNPTKETYAMIEKILAYLKNTKQEGLSYKQLDTSSLRLMLFTDAAFANTEECASQLGFVLVLADELNRANIIHFGSAKSRRVTRSIMAAELLALVYGFDFAFVIRNTLNECLQKEIPLDAYLDSRTVFNTVAKRAGTLEKRLQIDVCALRQAHYLGELRTLAWIPGKSNPADGLTRKLILKQDHPLRILMQQNKIQIKPQGWASSKGIRLSQPIEIKKKK